MYFGYAHREEGSHEGPLPLAQGVAEVLKCGRVSKHFSHWNDVRVWRVLRTHRVFTNMFSVGMRPLLFPRYLQCIASMFSARRRISEGVTLPSENEC